jgi:hypothetical protein
MRLVLSAFLLTACRPDAPPDPSALAARVDSIASGVLKAQLIANPEQGTEWGYPGAEHGRIRDNTLEGIARTQAREDSLYQVAQGIDPAPLIGAPQWITYGVLRDALERERALRVLDWFGR